MVLLSEVWPEAYAEGVLIINGDDGEEVDRTTPCENSGQRYPIIGNFEYDLLGFTESGNVLTFTQTPSVPRKFVFIICPTMKTNATGKNGHVSVFHNDSEIFPRSISGAFLKVSGEAQALAGSAFFVDLGENDTLDLRGWLNVAAKDIIITHLNYALYPIGRQY
jgi:hypothetical protein